MILSNMNLYVTLIILIAVIIGVEGILKGGTVYCKNERCSFSSKIDKQGGTAYGLYNDTLLENGWGILDISAGNGVVRPLNVDLMYAAGLLEGILTTVRIHQHYLNMHYEFFGPTNTSEYEIKARVFLKQQDQWMRSMIKDNQDDPLWRHTGYIIAQFDGLVAGYHMTYKNESLPYLDTFAFQMLNGAGDLLDLRTALIPDSVPDWRRMDKKQAMRYFRQNSHCSALVKVLGAYEDLFMSHSSWFTYAATMRIFKHYNLNTDDPSTAARKISFSSYPGFLESLDDFYMMSSQLVMLQTTNNVFNKELFKSVKPTSLMAWQRVRVANMMAHSGREWATTVARYNSGTYNNQYMVIDLKKIKLGETIMDDALWVVEQIPTLVQYGDLTPILRTGYWPSYNVPYFEDVYNKSGYPAVVAKFGIDMSYQLAPRAKIFRRDEAKVLDMVSFKHIMRYNDFNNDPYSEDDPCNTICCRGDLESVGPRADGCYDTKVTDYKMALELTADIINGPTIGNHLPPFKWTPEFNVSHVGLPPVYNFDFIRTKPSL